MLPYRYSRVNSSNPRSFFISCQYFQIWTSWNSEYQETEQTDGKAINGLLSLTRKGLRNPSRYYEREYCQGFYDPKYFSRSSLIFKFWNGVLEEVIHNPIVIGLCNQKIIGDLFNKIIQRGTVVNSMWTFTKWVPGWFGPNVGCNYDICFDSSEMVISIIFWRTE